MSTGKPRDPQKERFWRQMFQRWHSSGLTVQAFCRQRQLSQASFYAWRRTLASRDAETVHFTEVQVLADEASPRPFPPLPQAALELVLGNQRVLRIGTSFDATTLRRLLPILEEDMPC
jgi:transposase